MKKSITSEFRLKRMDLRRVTEKARQLDIKRNPAPEAIFEEISTGFNLWCIPNDHPGGDWEKVKDKMIPGAFSKPCAFVGTVWAKWDEGVNYVIGMNLTTEAYHLRDYLPDEYVDVPRDARNSIHGRSDDWVWAQEKIAWLFKQAGVPCPPIYDGSNGD